MAKHADGQSNGYKFVMRLHVARSIQTRAGNINNKTPGKSNDDIYMEESIVFTLTNPNYVGNKT